MTVLSAAPRHTRPADEHTATDKGFGIMEWGGVALGIILVLAIVLGGLFALTSRTNTGTELTNIQTIIASTRGLLKASGGYEQTALTSTLIKAGGVSRSMSISSDKSKLYNTWGGEIIVKGTGTNTFTVSYAAVPQDACISLSTQIGRGGLVNETKINAKTFADGRVSASQAATACTADSAGKGLNTMIFTVTG
ncbi:type 4 pilus major pilin [Klebsiella sp. PL-2018]|uniref:type 4 pilus major pilin n=1 Tax=Klebsiella TaxID=570 RepID=UPI001C214BA4|nr:type 4 pilus major pilin [Klebsiella sp. PL-2018]QXD00970.1 hypothetical protein MKleb_5469 [Klebsiella sp. PL-2018]